MLNDLKTFVRTSAFLQTFGPGLALGGMLGLTTSITAGLVMAGCGLAAMVLWAIWSVVTLRRAEARLWADVTAGSQEILDGRVQAVRAPGQVVRRRIRRKAPAFVTSRGRMEGPALACAVTVVGAGAPRRVGVLVPGTIGLGLHKAPVMLAVHPERPEVAVLDDRVTREELGAIAGDPRFGAPDVPTDASVRGRWPAIVLMALLGAASGAAVGYLVCLLAG